MVIGICQLFVHQTPSVKPLLNFLEFVLVHCHLINCSKNSKMLIKILQGCLLLVCVLNDAQILCHFLCTFIRNYFLQCFWCGSHYFCAALIGRL